jgi:hypothetical protein
MSKRVKKHCSILNYIKHSDNDLYDLIQDLCIGRIFMPKKNSPGLTFLRPSKELLSKIKDMASGDDPEEAVAALQSLVLLDHLPTIDDFADKKTDIPTFLHKKLPVKSIDAKEKCVHLNNGAKIVADKDFEARNDRGNISVYVISGHLVPTDTDPSNFSNAKPKNNRTVKGGADFTNSKKTLFDNVLKECCNCDFNVRDPAMEVLVSLCQYLKIKGSPKLNLVLSQLSCDTLASLAIILQPYKSTSTYIDNTESVDSNANIAEWLRYWSRTDTIYYAYVTNPAQSYMEYMEQGKQLCHNTLDKVNTVRSKLVTILAKPTVVSKLYESYKLLSVSDTLPNERKETLKNSKLALAESELRVYSALLRESSIDNRLDKYEAERMFKNMCTLDVPYMMSDKDLIKKCNIGFYFSTAYMIARSDAFVYLPGLLADGVSMFEVADESKNIKLCKVFEKSMSQLDVSYGDSASARQGFIAEILKEELKSGMV